MNDRSRIDLNGFMANVVMVSCTEIFRRIAARRSRPFTIGDAVFSRDCLNRQTRLRHRPPVGQPGARGRPQ
jgi:hypothetical protein